uniref:Fucolectin tachylectin-4 pentraxin-1 domain-containing protein n=1 Tax=Magallana gigas TaxID=29159 RepID=A0A8W8P080_MAGGI
MIHPQWIVLVGLLCCAHCYENLSRRPTTVLTQSSTYHAQTASIANDGDVQTNEQHCAHTAHNHPKAWLQVDFGQSYSINNVKIYYRKEATQTTTSQRTRCYTDNTTAPDLPPNIIDITCKQTARYVIVETTYDAPEDEITGAILEICEIEVYDPLQTQVMEISYYLQHQLMKTSFLSPTIYLNH